MPRQQPSDGGGSGLLHSQTLVKDGIVSGGKLEGDEDDDEDDGEDDDEDDGEDDDRESVSMIDGSLAKGSGANSTEWVQVGIIRPCKRL